MKRSRAAFLVVGLVLLLAVQVLCTSMLLAPAGARMQWPEPGSRHGLEFIASGDAWAAPGPGAIVSLRVEAVPGSTPGAEPLGFPAERPHIRYGGQSRYALPTWTARVALPSEGDWSLKAVALTTDGRRIESAGRRILASAALGGVADRGFSSWSVPHLSAIGFILLGALAVAYFARKGGPSWLRAAAPWIVLVMWANELAYQSYWMAVGGWSHSVSLMLQMCGLSIIFLPICLFMNDGPRRRRLADVLYFWGLGGAAQAILTPDIGASGFPSYRYFSFFISHGMIIVAVIALVASGSVKIGPRSLARCIIVSNIVVVPAYLVDRLLALVPPYAPGNYFALGYPPPTGSPIDLLVRIFGPSPRYILGLEIMGVLVFALLWLPWGIAARARAQDRVSIN
jgi:hypothetical integral membrane protein (TIGR02206 family)